ncbi:MAG: hypothetical protein AAFR29_07430, partial [Pseudomonadota bacterium]
MVEFFKIWGEAFSRMDQKSWASLGVSALLLAGLLTVYFFGQQWLHLDGAGTGGVSELMARAGAAPLALLAVIVIFVLLAMTGFPQVLLITA